MNRKSWIIAGAVALLFIAGVPLVHAERSHAAMHGMRGGGPDGGFGPLAKLQRLRTELGLTDDQVTQIRTITLSIKDQNAPYRDQMRGTMRDAAKLLLADPNNIAGAQALLDQQAAAEKSLRQNMLKGFSQALNVLTPDQREKLAGILAARQAGHGGQF